MSNTTTIITKLAEQKEISKKAAKETVDTVLDLVLQTLLEEGTIRLSGFGTFTIKDTEARTGRNPSTGEALEIPASKRVSFKPASNLKTAVKEG